MRVFDFLKQKPKDGKFMTDSAYKRNCKNQMVMSPRTLEQLRKLDVLEDIELKLEFFFYTNTSNKAELFAKQIESLGYSVDHGVSAGDKNQFVITGWTDKIKMEDEIVQNWTKQMCELGKEYDCEFDGWGTTPDQKDI